jgi:hypothetical protein
MYDTAVLVKEEQAHLTVHDQQELKPAYPGHLLMPMRTNIGPRLEGDEDTLHPFSRYM